MKVTDQSTASHRRAERIVFGVGGVLLVGLFAAGLLGGREPPAEAALLPASDGEVIEKLPAGAGGREGAALRAARAVAARGAASETEALALARRYVELSRKSADPRWHGHADVVLRPFGA